MKEQIKFSVLIPYYNEGEKVIYTIKSLQVQSYTNWELVCVNDGSTDNTLDILNNLAANDNRIRIVTKENGGTPAKAINYGIPYLTGDYYFYSSKDDYFEPDFFLEAYNVLESKDYDVVVPNLYLHFENYDKLFFDTSEYLNVEMTGERLSELCAFGKVQGNAFFKVAIVKSVGCYSFSYNSDEYSAVVYYKKCKLGSFCKSSFYYNQCDPTAYTRVVSLKELTQLETNVRLLELFSCTENKELSIFLINKNLRFFVYYLLKCMKNQEILKSISNRNKIREAYRQYYTSISMFIPQSTKDYLLKILASNFYSLLFATKVRSYLK